MTRHFLSINDVSTEELLSLTEPGLRAKTSHCRQGLLSMLFEQPSLRTMSSFASAGVQAGLTPIAITTTGDALRDQCDIPDELSQLSLISSIVVSRTLRAFEDLPLQSFGASLINAGDGSNEHPSQALADIAAMRRHQLENKHVVLMGNLRDHRVHHSLAMGLKTLGVSFSCVSPEGLLLPSRYGCEEHPSYVPQSPGEVDDILSGADFVYLTPTKYWNTPAIESGAAFSLNLARAKSVLKTSAKVFHPFPRLGELAHDVDGSPYDGYSDQVRHGPEIRRRLLELLLPE